MSKRARITLHPEQASEPEQAAAPTGPPPQTEPAAAAQTRREPAVPPAKSLDPRTALKVTFVALAVASFVLLLKKRP